MNTTSTVKLIKSGNRTMRDIKVICPECQENTWILKVVSPFPAKGEVECFYCKALLEYEEIDKGGGLKK